MSSQSIWAGIRHRRFARMLKAVSAMACVTTVILFAATGSALAQSSSKVDPCKAKATYEAAKKATDQENAKQFGFADRVNDLVRVKPSGLSKPVPEATVRDWIKSLKEQQSNLRSLVNDPNAGKVSREVAKKRLDKISPLIPELETWLKARKKADDNLKQTAKDYNVTEAHKAISNAKVTFNNEQARMTRIKGRLEGRPKDEAYKRDAIEMMTHARETYVRLLSFLGDYDCFSGVRAFMDDLQQRMKTIDKNLDTLRAFKVGTGDKPTKGRGADLSGAWVTLDKIRMSLKSAGANRWQGIFDEDHYKYDITLVAVSPGKLRGTVFAKTYGIREQWIGIFNDSQIVLRTPKGGAYAFKRK